MPKIEVYIVPTNSQKSFCLTFTPQSPQLPFSDLPPSVLGWGVHIGRMSEGREWMRTAIF